MCVPVYLMPLEIPTIPGSNMPHPAVSVYPVSIQHVIKSSDLNPIGTHLICDMIDDWQHECQRNLILWKS